MKLNHVNRVNPIYTILLSLAALAICGAASQAAAEVLDASQLPKIEGLPNPFLMNDGTTVQTGEDWRKRRGEIKEILEDYSYGHMPPAPDNLSVQVLSEKSVFDSEAVERRLLLTMGPDDSVKLNARMIIPKGDGPFPVILKNVHAMVEQPIAREVVKRGYIYAEYTREQLAPDEKETVGPAHAAYPDYDWSTLAVWAWGGSRVIDYFMTQAIVDKERIATTGHSRGGKAALLLGAFDERVTLTVPNGSGCGGSGCYRLLGPKCETLEIITNAFPYWFIPRLKKFAGKEEHLPFDQHFVKALVAPRGLLSTDSKDDRWANPYGTQQTTLAAKTVYNFLGAGDRIGLHFRTAQHDQTDEDWHALLDFADRLFFGKKVERQFDALPYPADEKAVTWETPAPIR